MKKNFLFVVPRFAKKGEYYPFPYGLGYVIANMKKHGFNVFVLNLCHHEESFNDLLFKAVLVLGVDVVCTGGMSVHWNEIEEVLNGVKSFYPDVVTVVGGAIVTSDPELALKNLPIDFGVIGEGEETMVALADALCNDKVVEEVHGVCFMRDSKVFFTEPRPPIQDLDSLPFPDYEALGFDEWIQVSSYPKRINWLEYGLLDPHRSVDVFASRSCPFRCTFCYHPLGNQYRQRSLDNVFQEIRYLKEKYGITSINFQDELFSVDKARVCEFASRIKGVGIEYFVQWRVDNVDEKMLLALRDSGVRYLELGVESFSDTVLKSMGKGTTRAQIENAYRLCDKVGIRVISNVILGDPAETEDTIKESLDWVRYHPEYDINIGFILAIPDSELWRYAISKGLISDKFDFIKKRFPVINLTGIDSHRFRRIQRKVAMLNLRKKNIVPGKLVSSKSVSDFIVECPVCGQESRFLYQRYSVFPFSIVVCKHCFKRFKVSTKEAFHLSFFSWLWSISLMKVKIMYVSLFGG